MYRMANREGLNKLLCTPFKKEKELRAKATDLATYYFAAHLVMT